MSDDPTPPTKPKGSDYFKSAWAWAGIIFTSLGAVNNAFKDVEPTWLKEVRPFGPLVLLAGILLITKASYSYSKAWVKYVYAKFLRDISAILSKPVAECKSAETLHCPALTEVQKLHQPFELITKAIVEKGPQAEERLFALARGFHDINEAYRDHMAENKDGSFDDANIRKPFLEQLCSRLAKIFQEAWHIDDAVVSIKRAFKDDNGPRPKRVFTYARSRACPERDGVGKMNYALDHNTAFQTAATRAHNSRFYFHSNDLRKHENYRNERETKGDDWTRYYLSTIVVPIQCKAGTTEERELIGFLTIDSSRTGVFNTESHLYVMAAVADQLFNYFRITDAIQASDQAATSGRKKLRDKGKPS